MGPIRRVAILILAVVAGVIGVFFIICAFSPHQLLWCGEILVRAASPSQSVSAPSVGAPTMAVLSRIIVAAIGLAHLLVAFCAVWPEMAAGRGGVQTVQTDETVVRIPHAVIEDYVLKILRRVEGINNAKVRVETTASGGLALHLRAAFDVSHGTVPALTRKLRQAVHGEMDRTFGQAALEAIRVDVTRVTPPEGRGPIEQRTVMSVDRSEREAEPEPASEVEVEAAPDKPPAYTEVPPKLAHDGEENEEQPRQWESAPDETNDRERHPQ